MTQRMKSRACRFDSALHRFMSRTHYRAPAGKRGAFLVRLSQLGARTWRRRHRALLPSVTAAEPSWTKARRQPWPDQGMPITVRFR